MGKTLCKVCGYAGAPGETQCPQCGAPLWPVETTEANPPAPADEVYITTEPKRKKPRNPRRAHLCMAAGFLAVCLLVQGLGLWTLTAPTPKGRAWSLVWYGELITPEGIVPLEEGVEPVDMSSGLGPRQLLRGREDFILGHDRPRIWIYYFDGKTVQVTDWTSALLSRDNQVLFYVTDLPEGGQALFRRDERTGQEQELDRGEQLGVFTCDVFGDALSYLKQTGEDVQALLWRRDADGPETPVGLPKYLGPGGHSYLAYNYAVGDQNIGGSETWYWAVVWGDGNSRSELTGGAFFVDRDMTEFLRQDEAGAWHYENAAGEQAQVEGLPNTLRRVLRENEGFDPMGLPVHVTDWLYVGGDGALYYLSKDLTVTNLSGTAAIQRAVMDAEGDTLFYLATEKGEANTALYRVDEPLSPDRRIVRELAQDDVKAFAVSPDGSNLLAKVRPGGTPGAMVCKISVDAGPWQTVDMDAPADSDYYVIDGVQLMNSGGCWYLDDGSFHKALHYRGPAGETETKLTWTSLLSSTMYPDEPGAVTLPGGAMEVEMELISVSGDEALLRVSFDDGTDGTEAESEARYWLLDGDGSMTELEYLEVS